jgi:hypothetical protein
MPRLPGGICHAYPVAFYLNRHGAKVVATGALHFQIAITGVEGVAEQWRWLRRPAMAFHEYSMPRRRPNPADLARFPGALLGGLDGRAEVPEEAAYSGLLDQIPDPYRRYLGIIRAR